MSLGLVGAALSSSVPVVDPSPKEDSLVTCWSVMTTGKSRVIPLEEFKVLIYRVSGFKNVCKYGSLLHCS